MPTNSNYSTVLFDNGEVYSCGKTDNGKLGLGHDILRFGTVSYLNKVDLENGAISVSSGPEHSLIVTRDGTLWFCGLQLSVNCDGSKTESSMTSFNFPVKMVGTSVFITKCSAGSTFSLALDDFGKVWGCGMTNTLAMGSIGKGTGLCTLRQIPELSDIVDISAGGKFSLVLGKNSTGTTSSENLLFSGAINSPDLDGTIYGITTINQTGNFKKVFGEYWDLKADNIKSITSNSNYFVVLCDNGCIWLFGNYCGIAKIPLKCRLPPLMIDNHTSNNIFPDKIYAMGYSFIMRDTIGNFYTFNFPDKQWIHEYEFDGLIVLSHSESTIFFCRLDHHETYNSDILVYGTNYSGECGYDSIFCKTSVTKRNLHTLNFEMPYLYSNMKSALSVVPKIL